MSVRLLVRRQSNVIGADGRAYVVDVHRLFPAEGDFKVATGVLIPTDPNVPASRALHSFSRTYSLFRNL